MMTASMSKPPTTPHTQTGMVSLCVSFVVVGACVVGAAVSVYTVLG